VVKIGLKVGTQRLDNKATLRHFEQIFYEGLFSHFMFYRFNNWINLVIKSIPIGLYCGISEPMFKSE